jgi:hypothetical protein
MSQTPPPTIAPAPAPIQRGDRSTFSDRLDAFVLWLTNAVTSFGNVATNAYNNALDCYNNAVAAASSASTASAAAGTATQTANATLWVSGTAYVVGNNAISPLTFQTFRRKIAGAGTTDPSIDVTNWAPIITTPTSTVANPQTSATDVTLASTAAGVQAIAMTAPGKSVLLPSATSMGSVGGPLFVIRNNGAYPFGVRDNTGVLLVAVAAGGSAYLTLESKASAAGTWGITGTGLEPGLVTLDQTLSTTYGSTVYAQSVALDANTSLHFAALSSGFAAFVVDNTGKAIGTPVTVSAAAGSAPRAAFKISATQAILFYGASATDHQAVVLTLSGASPSLALAVGTPAALTATAQSSWDENGTGAPKIAQLSPSLYVASYTSGAPGNAMAVAISVSGASVSIGAPITAITGNFAAPLSTTYALTATTALVIGRASSDTRYWAVVVTVSGTNCAPGTAVTTGLAGGTTMPPSSVLVSPTKCILASDGGTTSLSAVAVTINGTSVAAGALLAVDTLATGSSADYTSGGSTRFNPHLWTVSAGSTNLIGLWALDRAAILSETGGVLTKGGTLYGSFSSAASGASGYGVVSALQGATDFVAITQHGAAGAWRKIAVPHKINGTTITYGNGHALPELSPVVQADAVPSVRLAQGDYLLFSPNASSLPVLRSNGDALARRGAVSLPNLGGPTTCPLAAVSSNRLLLAATTAGSAASGAQQLRILNIEVAA